MTMMMLRVICEAVLLLMLVAYASSKGKGKRGPHSRTPLWKSLLVHHQQWAGYYVHDQTRYMCRLKVHSVEKGDQGTASVTFTSEGFHIEMTGFSDDNEVVMFREVLAWNKSGHFDGHTDIVFQGSFISDYGYYRFVGNVSSQESRNYGSVSLIPQGQSSNTKEDKAKPKIGLAMAITIPLVLGLIIFNLAIILVIWAVRKGYLRHVPWNYKTFRNPKAPKSDLEMEGGGSGDPHPQTQAVETHTEAGGVAVAGIDATAVHM